MCGICGYVGIHEDGLLEKMTAALAHRGPDGVGYFKTDEVGLGHRRLSIIDVAGGQQPIENEDGSLVLICNGEVYNYRELREELLSRGHRFRTKSDSEVILHLYEDMGPDCLQRMAGMWALAIYDRDRQRLFVARDRLGIKPLYYVHVGIRFLFASECKSILRYHGFEPTINPRAIHDYLTLRYVPGPNGMFKEIRKLPAGHYAIIENGQITLSRYWEPELYEGPFNGTDEQYLEGFAERFERSIRRRLISEVPLGAYLSGGIDSSAIVGAMAKLVSTPIRTFTVGFDYGHDELAQAAATAKLLGCEHTEIACCPSDIELLPRVVYHLDEPIGDPIIIPTYQLAEQAKKEVSVILTGEGADETLGGYLFHKALLAGHRLACAIPRSIRRAVLSPALAITPASLINLAFDYPARLGQRGKVKVLDFLRLLEAEQLPYAYRHLISLFDERDTTDLYTGEFKKSLNGSCSSEEDFEIVRNKAPYLNRILHLQFSHWLPDLILMRQDKMSMAHGIEARVPFLDHELVEYVLKLPPSLKIRAGKTKYILRQYANRILPKQVTMRRKMPFYVPLEKCFSEPAFQTFVQDALSNAAIVSRGILSPQAVSKLRRSMHRGEFVFVKQVFSLVVLELWLRMAVDRRGIV
jgi:asparagine synthase (glutamine-hydrolysing)